MRITTEIISDKTFSMEDPNYFWEGDNLLQRDPYEDSLVEAGVKVCK